MVENRGERLSHSTGGKRRYEVKGRVGFRSETAAQRHGINSVRRWPSATFSSRSATTFNPAVGIQPATLRFPPSVLAP